MPPEIVEIDGRQRVLPRNTTALPREQWSAWRQGVQTRHFCRNQAPVPRTGDLRAHLGLRDEYPRALVRRRY